MKLGEIVVHMDNYKIFTKFQQNQMKKKVLLIAHFSVQNFKVSIELWKSYIVRLGSKLSIYYTYLCIHDFEPAQIQFISKFFGFVFLKKMRHISKKYISLSSTKQHMNCGRKINIMYTKEFLLAVTNVSVGRQQQASRQDVKQDKEKITC